MDTELVFCAKYPYSLKAKELLESFDISKVTEEQLEEAVERINNALRGVNASDFNKITSFSETRLKNAVVSFPLAKLIAACSNEFIIMRKLAEAEAYKTYYFLQADFINSDSTVSDEKKFMEVVNRFFKVTRKGNRFGMRFQDFLNNKPDDKNFKLVMQEINNGVVWVDARSLAKIVSEAVKNSVLSFKKPRQVPEKIIKAVERIEAVKPVLEADFGSVEEQFFPPCIKSIISELLSGVKVSHYPRFVLATFFANIGMSVDKAVEYFRNQPNFSERKTKYYLEHALGKKGGTKYSVPSCSKMESYGLCKKDNTCRWKHPISYYKNMKRNAYG